MISHYPSEQALLEGLRANREDAFRSLYDEQHAAIYNLCARILGNREEAKDVTQDTFVTALSQPPLGGSSLRAWLYRVATNACFNHLRSRKAVGGDGDEVLDELPEPVDAYEQAQTVALVEESLAQLNERYRTALVLKDLHGLPPEEIADVMEVSRANADVLVHRARASFKTVFAKLAGDVPAPASLGLALAPLVVPAALHALPPLPHVGIGVPHAVPHVAPPHVVPHAGPVLHGPHGAGLLGKIGAALTAKAAITTAAATLVVGGAVGGTVAVRVMQHSPARGSSASLAHAWQSPCAKWSRQWCRWSLHANWARHGWPMNWKSGHWRWNSRSGGWSWQMSDGTTWSWSSGGRQTASSGGWSGGSWTMSMSDSYSTDWSFGGRSSASGSSPSRSGSSGGSSGGSRSSGSSGGDWSSGSHDSRDSGSGGDSGW